MVPTSFRLLWKGWLQSGQPTPAYMWSHLSQCLNSLGRKEGFAWAEAAPQEDHEERRESHEWQMERESRERAVVMNHCKGISPAGCKYSQTAWTRGKSKKEMRDTVQCCLHLTTSHKGATSMLWMETLRRVPLFKICPSTLMVLLGTSPLER